MQHKILRFLTVGFIFFSTSNWLYAQSTTSIEPEVSQHSWVLQSPNNEPSTYFVNLKDGDNVSGDRMGASAPPLLVNVLNQHVPGYSASALNISR